jgi:hypothetical protein
MPQIVKVKISDPGIIARRDKDLLHIRNAF